MEILNLGSGSDESAKLLSKKRLKVAKSAIGIGGLAALTGLGSTFAANISLNDGANSVEFGQGVAQTAACDEDGFTITPVSYYDADLSAFRLDYVEVSGLNLTPMGSNYADSGETFANTAAAITAHPGQYWDDDANENNGGWINTCDQVVLDFKAYTDNTDYVGNTLDGYTAIDAGNTLPNTTSSPLFWSVDDTHITNPNYDSDNQHNSDIAIIFDATNDVSNYGTVENAVDSYGDIDYTSPADNDGTGYVKESSFRFFNYYGHYNDPTHEYSWDDPAAGAIAKITVESMKYFPSGYSIGNDPAYDSVPGDYGYYILGSQEAVPAE